MTQTHRKDVRGTIHELQHAVEKYRIITQSEDILERSGAQLVAACKLQVSAEVWADNFNHAIRAVQEWARQWSADVAAILVEIRTDKVVFFIVPTSETFNFRLAEAQSDLDHDLLTRFGIGYVESRQIPGDELDRFVSPLALRVWPAEGEGRGSRPQ
jgi:hypothetical protein